MKSRFFLLHILDLAADLEIPKNSYHITNIDSLAFDLSQKFGLRKTTDKVFGMNAVKSPQEVWGYVLDENLSNFDEDFLKKEYEEVILVQNISSQTEYLKASRIGRGKAISKSQRLDVWKLIEFFLEKKLASGFYYKEEIYNKVANHLEAQGLTVYSKVIVDELQDFTNVELNFIRALTPIAADDLFLVGDPLQNIYNRKINFSKAGINIRGNRSKRLRINYRTTEEIKRLAFSVVSNEHYDDFDGETEEKSGYLSLFHGVVPIYQLFANKQSELDNVLQEINRLFDEGIRYNEIVIAARTKDSVNDFRNLLHK
ncbi:MAG: UvrD-helicase domain-containing protein, partial [Flavobacterium sp.]